MTKEGVREIEERLGVKLPRKYAALMTSPDAAAALGEFWYRSLFNDPKVIIDRTNWLRDLLSGYGVNWNATYVVVSEINGGDGVIMDAATDPVSLLVFDHETNLIKPFITLSEFAEAAA